MVVKECFRFVKRDSTLAEATEQFGLPFEVIDDRASCFRVLLTLKQGV